MAITITYETQSQNLLLLKNLTIPVTVPIPDLWMDASDSDTLTLDGIDVDAWKNKVNVTESFTNTSTNRPIWTSGGLNGRPAIKFDLSNAQYLSYTGQILSASTGTIICVCSFSDDIDSYPMQVIFGQSDKDVAAQYSYVCRRGNTLPGIGTFFGASDIVGSGKRINTIVINTFTPYILTLRTTGVSSTTMRVNRSNESVTDTGWTWIGTPSNIDTCSIGMRQISTGISGYHDNYIAEIIAWDSAIDLDDMYAVENYLNKKYSVN